jgi:two-component system sensor histidine kinase and response regulator WspE
VKGAARIVGAPSLAAALHAAEDVLAVSARGEPMNPDAMQQLLTLLDTLDMAAARPADELPMWLAKNTQLFGTVESQLRANAAQRAGDAKGDAATTVGGGAGGVPVEPTELGAALAVAREAVEDSRLQRVSAETLTRLLEIAGGVVVEARRLGAFERGALALARVQSRLDERMGELARRAARSHDAGLMTLADMLVADAAEARALASEMQAAQSEGVERLLDVSEILFIEALRVRQRPFAGLLPTLRRHVRETSRALGKSARLEVSGSSLLIDGDVLAGLEPVLGHLVTNAIDHGIERESERLRRGKPAQGVIRVAVSMDRAELLVAVSDDGAGVDVEGVREAALANKLAGIREEALGPRRDDEGWVLGHEYGPHVPTAARPGRCLCAGP